MNKKESPPPHDLRTEEPDVKETLDEHSHDCDESNARSKTSAQSARKDDTGCTSSPAAASTTQSWSAESSGCPGTDASPSTQLSKDDSIEIWDGAMDDRAESKTTDGRLCKTPQSLPESLEKGLPANMRSVGLDTQSSFNVIRRSVADKIGLTLEPLEGGVVRAIKRELHPMFQVTVDWNVCKTEEINKCTFYVLEDVDMQEDTFQVIFSRQLIEDLKLYDMIPEILSIHSD